MFFREKREEKKNKQMSLKKVLETDLYIVRASTYYANSSVSGAVTLFDHRVTALVSPAAFFPVGAPNTLRATDLLSENQQGIQ